MTPQEINYCELLFTIIGRKLLPKNYTNQMYYQTCTYEMQIYMDWLLKRWVCFRNGINHYPKEKIMKKYLLTKYDLIFD